MPDLELLRAFLDDVPEPDAETVNHAREKLSRYMEAPVESGAGRPHRRWLAIGAGATAVAIAVVLLPVGGSEVPDPLASASEVLNRAAVNTERNNEAVWPSSGEYLYVRTKGAYLSSYPEDPAWSVMVPESRESWTTLDGSGRWLIGVGDPLFLSDRDRAHWREAGSPKLDGNHRSDQVIEPLRKNEIFASFGSGGLTLREFLSLPTDANELYARVEKAGRTTDNPFSYQMFVIVGDLFRTQLVSADLQAALYRVAADIPGIRLVGEVTDPVGRPGVAVTIDKTSATPGPGDPGLRRELIFDPKSGEFLAERDVMTAASPDVGAAPGTVVGYRVILETAVVDSTETRH